VLAAALRRLSLLALIAFLPFQGCARRNCWSLGLPLLVGPSIGCLEGDSRSWSGDRSVGACSRTRGVSTPSSRLAWRSSPWSLCTRRSVRSIVSGAPSASSTPLLASAIWRGSCCSWSARVTLRSGRVAERAPGGGLPSADRPGRPGIFEALTLDVEPLRLPHDQVPGYHVLLCSHRPDESG